jgi:hypothetical protein
MRNIKIAKPFGNGSHIVLTKAEEGKRFKVVDINDDISELPSDEEHKKWKEKMREAGVDFKNE